MQPRHSKCTCPREEYLSLFTSSQKTLDDPTQIRNQSAIPTDYQEYQVLQSIQQIVPCPRLDTQLVFREAKSYAAYEMIVHGNRHSNASAKLASLNSMVMLFYLTVYFRIVRNFGMKHSNKQCILLSGLHTHVHLWGVHPPPHPSSPLSFYAAGVPVRCRVYTWVKVCNGLLYIIDNLALL